MKDIDKAKIKELEGKPAFSLEDLESCNKILFDCGLTKEKAKDMTTRLCDLSMMLAISLDVAIKMVCDIKIQGFLSNEVSKRMVTVGIPIVGELIKKFSKLEGRDVCHAEVFIKINDELVSYDMIEEIIKDMTNEGHLFHVSDEQKDSAAFFRSLHESKE